MQVIFRSSFFIGLGWLLQKKTWKVLNSSGCSGVMLLQELEPRWPSTHWDHWMREVGTSAFLQHLMYAIQDAQRKGRDCLFPEVRLCA